jgi:hypothetical protein
MCFVIFLQNQNNATKKTAQGSGGKSSKKIPDYWIVVGAYIISCAGKGI